jgi:perosamine synthetase
MFTLKESYGIDHHIYKYDVSRYNFKTYLQEILSVDSLENVNEICKEYNENKEEINNNNYNFNDVETSLHKKFYSEIKKNDTFKKMYCELVKDLYNFFYIDEDVLIYQSYPSIRFQFENSIAVPEHYDADEKASHPLGEKNFLIPITKMENTNTILIESEPRKKDFKNINMDFGDIFYFNGNQCSHKNESNNEGWVRISFDFRVILIKDYYNYINNKIVYTNPRDKNSDRIPISLTIGSYYQVTFKNDSIEKMMNWFLPKSREENTFIMQHRPTFEKEEADSCYEYMLEDNFVTEHKKTKELEKIISHYLDVKHTIMTTSGTTALILSLMALDLKNGEEVIVPNFTMIATVNSIRHIGLTPVIVDVNSKTYSIELETIKKNITSKTKAVLHVSINNRFCDIDKISDYCKSNNLYLIEDAAQSMGCKSGDKFLGTFGDIGCFSLSSPKIISSGQGGYMVTNNDELALKISQIKNFGRKESGKDIFEIFGINQKYTDIQAVITIEQMKKLDYRVKRMAEIYSLYYENLKDYIEMLPPLFEGWHPWFVDIFCPSNEFRKNLSFFLKSHNIQTRETYVEINKTDMYYDHIIFPNSNKVSTKGLYLPSYVTLSNEQILHICNLIKTFAIANFQIFNYRKLEISDKDKYLSLMNGFRSVTMDMEEDEFNKIYNRIFNSGYIIVCEQNGELIGSVSILIEQKFIHNSARYAHIEDVFVDETHRHKKIGKELVNKAIEYCKSNNIFKISLNCAETLKGFYSLNNFEQRQINMSQLV